MSKVTTLSPVELKMALRAIETANKKAETEGKTGISAGAHDVQLLLRVTGVYVKHPDTQVTPNFNEALFLQNKIISWASKHDDPAAAVAEIFSSSSSEELDVTFVALDVQSQLAAAKVEFQASATKAPRAGSTSFAGLVEKVVNEQ